MALIQDAMQEQAPEQQPQQPQQPAQPDQPAMNDQGGGEQDAYSKTVIAGMKILYSPETSDGIVKMLQAGADDPAKALANTVSTIITQLDEKAKGAIPEGVILPASAELLGLTAELADKAGAFTADKNTITQAMQNLVKNLGDHYGMNPKQVQQAIQGMDQGEVQKMVSEQQSYQQPQEQPEGAM
jgi:hypothetical protein